MPSTNENTSRAGLDRRTVLALRPDAHCGACLGGWTIWGRDTIWDRDLITLSVVMPTRSAAWADAARRMRPAPQPGEG